MQTQDPKNWRNVVIAVTALLAVLLPTLGHAGSLGEAGVPVSTNCLQVTTRPRSDFLDAQGTTDKFFPPVQDMLGWTDGRFINFGLVDYAGLANAYIEETTGTSLGTDISGTVTECARDDGTAVISVNLITEHALGFAQSIQDLSDHNFKFLKTPTIFGAKAQDVVAGSAPPALGSAQFQITFVIAHPGDPLPDIRIAFQDNKPDVRPITLDFTSTTEGTLPDGTGASLHIHQVGATDKNGDLKFSVETVDIRPQ